MIKATGDDYVYKNADKLFITNKDGMLCFLKDQLGGLDTAVRNAVFPSDMKNWPIKNKNRQTA